MSHYLISLLSQEMGVGNIRSSLQSSDIDSLIGIAIKTFFLAIGAHLLRKAVSWARFRIEDGLFPTAYIRDTDAAHLWVLAWLAQDPAAQAQIKNFHLHTSESRSARKRDAPQGLSVYSPPPPPMSATNAGLMADHNVSWPSGEIIGQILPTYYQRIRVKHGKNYLWICRSSAGYLGAGGANYMQVETLLWQKNALKDFLAAAHHRYFSKDDQELLIFNPENGFHVEWQKPISRPARPWSSVILPETLKDDLLADVEKFMSKKEAAWYADRGIPHRRGYLFHGVPGAGKTTLATAIASKLGINIYVINPAQRGMDDPGLNKLFRECPARSMILIEDIDCVFEARNRSKSDTDAATSKKETEGEKDKKDDTEKDNKATDTARAPASPDRGYYAIGVTLSGLLNAIDGVSSQEGCILVASTNHPENLDPALRRPGRFDVQIPFYDATPEQAKSLFKHFYPLSADPTGDGAATTSADELDKLAADFASAVFPPTIGVTDVAEVIIVDKGVKEAKGVSMAALQGYLLGFKDDPNAAVKGAAIWAEGHHKDKMPRKVGRADVAKEMEVVQEAKATVGDKGDEAERRDLWR